MQPSAHIRAGNAAAAEPQSPTVADLWRRVAESLRSTLSEGNYSIWFGRAHPLELSATTFLLAVPNPFTKEWIEDRFMGELRTAVREVSGRDVDVAIVAGDAFEDNIPETPAERPPEPVPDAGATRSLEPLVQFHPRYTFDSFVIGASNRFAHAAALAVAEAVAQSYNPLFIYGGAGLGKTHLLHAIGHYVRHCQPDLIVRYITTEQFMNEFVLSLQRRTIPEFHRRHRAVDLLMVDDIQFLEGKERTQEEFFHTFNTLHPRSQVVLTSDRAPKMISTLEERLRTRFEWGLITDIQPPDLETRLAILQRKAETDGLSAPTEALDYIAERIQTNIRELEGALIRVAAFASLTRTEISVDLAQDVLQSLLPNTEARVTSDLIIRVTAKYFDVTPHEVISPSRSRPLVNARQTAMYLCRELTDLSLPAIGGRFGGRDHTTVLHATKKISKEMGHNPNVYEQVHELTARVRQQAAGV